MITRTKAILLSLAITCFTLYPIIELTKLIIQHSTHYGWNAVRIAEISQMWPLYITAMAIVYYLALKRQRYRG